MKVILAILLGAYLYSEDIQLSNWECHSDNFNYINYNFDSCSRDINKAVVRAKIWKIHRDDGLFEMTQGSIEKGFGELIESFKKHGILVHLYEEEIIYSDSLYYFAYNNRPFELMQSHSIDKYMNLYYLPNINYTAGSITGYGQAFNTPGNEMFVAGNECRYVGEELVCFDLADTFIPTHELGHCFGLLHTHSTSGGDEHVIRDDSMEACELNCDSSGDLLCDTEATESLKNDVSFDGEECYYNASDTDPCGLEYQPQIDNFMSYTHLECGTAFTEQQVNLMYYNIKNNTVVSKTVVLEGDLNDDSQINVLDAIAIVNIILSSDQLSDFDFWMGDVNNDQVINVLDIVELINLILS